MFKHQAELLFSYKINKILKIIYAKLMFPYGEKKYFIRLEVKRLDCSRKSHKLGLIQLLSGVLNKIPRDSWALSKVVLFVLASESASLQI
jgi:hypothetical protein